LRRFWGATELVSVGIVLSSAGGAFDDFFSRGLGLITAFGDRNGPYASFTDIEGTEAFVAIYDDEKQTSKNSTDRLLLSIPTTDIQSDYELLKDRGVEFLTEPQRAPESFGEYRFAQFRDPDGNLYEMNDGAF
jgi:catechol 2,3-dioxygenase-like lactoylglutathione lyase family enzyme